MPRKRKPMPVQQPLEPPEAVQQPVAPPADEEDDRVRGLRCPKCNCADTRVVYVRHIWHTLTRRRRECRYCGHRFSTLEQPEGPK